MRSMVEGACRREVHLTADAPSTALLGGPPFPACAGQDDFGSRPEQTSVSRVV